MAGLGEHVDEVVALDGIRARGDKHVQVAGQGGGIAGHVDDAGRAGQGQPAGDLAPTPGTGRVEDELVNGRRRRHSGQRRLHGFGHVAQTVRDLVDLGVESAHPHGAAVALDADDLRRLGGEDDSEHPDARIAVDDPPAADVTKRVQDAAIQGVEVPPAHLDEGVGRHSEGPAPPRQGCQVETPAIRRGQLRHQPVDHGPVERRGGLGAEEELVAVLAGGDVKHGHGLRAAAANQLTEPGKLVGDAPVVDQAALHRNRTPASRPVESEAGIARPTLAAHDVELPSPAVVPRVGHAVEPELGDGHPLPPHGVEDHVALQQQLGRRGDVLELAAAALGNVRAGRTDAVGGGLHDPLHAAEPRPALVEGERDLDQLTRNATADEEGPLIGVGEAEPAVNHALAADDPPGTSPEFAASRVGVSRRVAHGGAGSPAWRRHAHASPSSPGRPDSGAPAPSRPGSRRRRLRWRR